MREVNVDVALSTFSAASDKHSVSVSTFLL